MLRGPQGSQRDSSLLPEVDDNLDALKGALWFPTLDLKSGHDQVKMAKVKKTAFSCGQGS